MSKERKLYERKNILYVDTGEELPAVLCEAVTLRDQFAIAAFPVFMKLDAIQTVSEAADAAYYAADAMLRARRDSHD
jgi:hypothetical protein